MANLSKLFIFILLITLPYSAFAENFKSKLARFEKMDKKEAVKILSAECDKNIGSSCIILGLVLLSGSNDLENLTPKEQSTVFTALSKACNIAKPDDNSEDNIVNAGGCHMLGGMYFYGVGVVKDEKKGLSLLTQTCDYGLSDSCASLADIYKKVAEFNDDGSYLQGDKDRFMPLYKRACNLGDAGSCSELANMFLIGKSKDIEQAIEYYKKGCALGQSYQCEMIGSMYDDGKGVPKNPKEALYWYKTACYTEDYPSLGCYYAARMYVKGEGVEQDYFPAVDMFKKACDENHYEACNELAILYDIGKGARQDYKKANELYLKACNGPKEKTELNSILRSKVACYNLGIQHENGNGTKKSIELALKYYGMACDMKNQTGCDDYARLKRNSQTSAIKE